MAQNTVEEFIWDGDEMFAKLDEVTGLLHYYAHNPAKPACRGGANCTSTTRAAHNRTTERPLVVRQ